MIHSDFYSGNDVRNEEGVIVGIAWHCTAKRWEGFYGYLLPWISIRKSSPESSDHFLRDINC